MWYVRTFAGFQVTRSDVSSGLLKCTSNDATGFSDHQDAGWSRPSPTEPKRRLLQLRQLLDDLVVMLGDEDSRVYHNRGA